MAEWLSNRLLGRHKANSKSSSPMVGVIFQFFLFFFIFFFEEGGVYFLPLYIVLNFYSKIWISFIGVMNSCKFKSFCSNNINFYLLILISTTPWKFCSCSQEMKSTIVFFFILELFVVLEFCLLFIAYNIGIGLRYMAISTISITLA